MPKINLVPIELDKPRTLRLDFNALSRAETISGRNYLQAESWNNLSITEMTVLLWSALLHEDPKLKLDAVGAEIHGGNAAYVSQCLIAAQAALSPEPKEDADPLGSKPNRSTGSISGPSGA